MGNYNDACENKIYLMTSKIIYLFITNIWFLITISPVIIYFFTSGENLSIQILSFLGILIGPALATMFSVTGRAMRSDQGSATKDYFHFYKINLWQGLFVAAIINIILMIIYIDIGYFYAKDMNALAYIFIGAAVLIGVLCIYIYPILSRINAKTIDLFKISIRMVFQKIYITLTSISLLIIGFAIVKFTSLSLVAVLFGSTAVCYMILKLEKNTLKEVEEFLKEKYS